MSESIAVESAASRHALRLAGLSVTLALVAALAGCGKATGSLQSSAQVLGVADLDTIEFTGTGRWYQFGQAPAPTLAWPQFDVSNYDAAINFRTAAAKVNIARIQTVEPGRARPIPTEQKVGQYVSGIYAWNLTGPNDAERVPATQPAAVEERAAEIWTTPQGFLKAALVNDATSAPSGNNVSVKFTIGGKYRYEGTINANNQVEHVSTWIDNPVLGDTLIETTYSNYRDFGGVQFPEHIVRTQGGYPVLDITVASVKANPAVDIAVPVEVSSNPVPAVTVNVATLAPGVFYFTGGTHHSVVVEQQDHVVVIEAPQNEARSLAVIAKVKETIPNKPIKYLINTHAHFDHAGGLRTYVDDGATIVTHANNKAYYQQIWALPHNLNPDRLTASRKPASFETFTDRDELTDGKRRIQVFSLAGSGHNDAFSFVYLPTEKILVEADAYTPTAAGAPLPTSPNPYSVNLYDNVQKLKLDVKQIAALHGPGVASLADLRAAIGQK